MKMNRRIFATILGIAFCVTYLAGTTAMVGGLHNTTESLASSFDQGPVLVYTDEDFASSNIDGALLPTENTTFVAFTFANAIAYFEPAIEAETHSQKDTVPEASSRSSDGITR